jgi:hypothetical protein
MLAERGVPIHLLLCASSASADVLSASTPDHARLRRVRAYRRLPFRE